MIFFSFHFLFSLHLFLLSFHQLLSSPPEFVDEELESLFAGSDDSVSRVVGYFFFLYSSFFSLIISSFRSSFWHRNSALKNGISVCECSLFCAFLQIVSKIAVILERLLSTAVIQVQRTLKDFFTVQHIPSIIEDSLSEVFRSLDVDSIVPNFETVCIFIEDFSMRISEE